MTIPSDTAEIENLKKIAELNKEAGDWQYSPVSEPMVPDNKSAIDVRMRKQPFASPEKTLAHRKGLDAKLAKTGQEFVKKNFH